MAQKFLDLAGLQYYHTKKVKEPILDKKGQPSGFAELDATGKIPATQLPSYVDDIAEYDKKANFPQAGETGKIYVAKDTNIIYRWSGTAYVEISSTLALGTTASTAYRGDLGNVAYKHSQIKTGNPHGVKFAELADRPTKLSQFTNDIKAFNTLKAGDTNTILATASQTIEFANSTTISSKVAGGKVQFDFIGQLPAYASISEAEIDTIV